MLSGLRFYTLIHYRGGLEEIILFVERVNKSYFFFSVNKIWSYFMSVLPFSISFMFQLPTFSINRAYNSKHVDLVVSVAKTTPVLFLTAVIYGTVGLDKNLFSNTSLHRNISSGPKPRRGMKLDLEP